jgi:hypothetical protein
MLKKQTKVEDINEEELLDSLTDEELEQLARELEADEDEEDTVSESSAEVDGTGGVPDGASKPNAMSIAMKKLASMTPDQVGHFLASLDQVGHEGDPAPDASAQNQASIAMKGRPDSITDIQESLKKALKEDLATVFGDSKELTEEFKEKITTLFESAVSYRVSQIETQLTEAYDEAFNEEVEEFQTTLSEQIDSYISYIAEEWMKENEVAITNSLNFEIASEFMEGLKALFEEHYITVPDEKQDLVDVLSNKIEELEKELNSQLETNIKLQETVKNTDKEKLVNEATVGLTVSQKEKFKQLVESTEYDGDDEAFKKKLDIVKDSHFGSKDHKKASTNIITEEIAYSPEEASSEKKVQAPINDPVMRNLVSAVSRTIKS